MGQRGRKSSKVLTVIGPHGLEPVERPKPHPSLPEEAAEEWRLAVNAMSADYFRPETLPLLERRCLHIVWGRHLAQMVNEEEKKTDGFDEERYNRLIRSATNQTYVLGVLDSKLRLTQESVYDRFDAKPSAKKAPWKAA